VYRVMYLLRGAVRRCSDHIPFTSCDLGTRPSPATFPSRPQAAALGCSSWSIVCWSIFACDGNKNREQKLVHWWILSNYSSDMMRSPALFVIVPTDS